MAGISFLHVVDLDGAKNGTRVNHKTIEKIRKSFEGKIQIGGGIRNIEAAQFYLNELKIDRIIIGTAAIGDKTFLESLLTTFGAEKIVVGVDVKDGFVSGSGWLDTSAVLYSEFIPQLEKIGVKFIVATDISKDGTLNGPNWQMYKQIKEVSDINFVVSGGVKSAEDIKYAKKNGYYGCIVGKAYYDDKITLSEITEAF
jgi:phosphoribosylformimino-5-aminoimidazole carboxamide ribotide isomerase